jgi:nucleoside-diphosphate kinase
MQRTLVLIKPDAVKNDLWLDIIRFYEKHNLKITSTRILTPMPLELAEQLYAEHKGQHFYDSLIAHMTQGITIALMIVGYNVVALVRAVNGATKPEEAVEGTVRYKFGFKGKGPANAVHGSANPTDAEKEVNLFFK